MNTATCVPIFRSVLLHKQPRSFGRTSFPLLRFLSSKNSGDSNFHPRPLSNVTRREPDLASNSVFPSQDVQSEAGASSTVASLSESTTDKLKNNVEYGKGGMVDDMDRSGIEEGVTGSGHDQIAKGFPRISEVFKSPARGQTFEPQDVMDPDPLMDLFDSEEFPAEKDVPWPAKVIVRNDPSMFLVDKARRQPQSESTRRRGKAHVEEHEEEDESTAEQNEDDNSMLAHLPMGSAVHQLYRFPLLVRRVTQQTGKGKIHRQYVMMIVGNGNGLVGMGEGKADEATDARTKAFAQAVRNMDYVERFENRTIWTDLETKLGATRIIMRPRPVGFGLHCNPNIHQVLKAAGIKDISAKVWGSRNPLNVIKATFRMIQAGHAPLSMGDGIGGPARKLNKGSGVVGKQEVERMRGRKLVDLRTW